MTNDEWLETPAADAITNFLAVMFGMLASALGGVVGGFFTKLGSAFFLFMADQDQPDDEDKQPNKLIDKLRKHLDPDSEDPRRYGLMLVAAWSAFESSFDDFAKALIMERSDRLHDQDLSKIKVPITQLFAGGEEKAEVVLEGIKATVGKTSGVKRCESILKYVDLNGNVPQSISAEVHHSQMIRHIWAHRVGIADAQFVAKAPRLGFSQGDLVSVEPAELTKYLNAILMYAMIVMNRHRAVHGLEPVTDLFSDKTDESLKAAFDGLYATEGSGPSTSPSRSDPDPALPTPKNAEEPLAQTNVTD